jgi:hypothetical protein
VLPAPDQQTAEQPLSPFYEHPECGFHWHGRDDMDIPMRDGQPVCPRCELRSVEKRLAHFERRCVELREESLRRGKNVLEHSEKNRALEREIDGVRRQLGAEILRANHAEAELRRLAGEAQQDKAEDGTATLPCNWARTQYLHAPHLWEPQPGMEPVHCPGSDPRSGQPDTELREIRCEAAFWTKTPHPPHLWRQGPNSPERRCPGVPAPPE